MSVITSLKVNNWRRFDSVQLHVPTGSGMIIDNNGTGKTSILAALYSLITKEPWPQTRYFDHLKVNEQYFGVSTIDKTWELLGKINPSGRMSIKHTTPEHIGIPRVLTYTPDDNLWLFSSRAHKLQTLDTVLAQIFGVEYTLPLKTLDKAVKQKNSTLKRALEEQSSPDEILLQTLHLIIIQNSMKLWELRWKYFDTLLRSFEVFESWIHSPLMGWSIDYEIQSFRLIKSNIHECTTWESLQSIIQKELLDDQVLKIIQQREKHAGRALYGAQRDNFDISSHHRLIQNVLSRGEMRLWILFTRKIAYELINKLDKKAPVYFLLDDIFNELDEVREKTTYQLILESFDYWLATGTKIVHVDVPTYRITDLCRK